MAGNGTGWRRWWPGASSGPDPAADGAAAGPQMRKPEFRRNWRYTELKFSGSVTQSRMRTFQPDHLLVDYTRTMMGALLFRPQPRLIGMIGLGGGSQAKFCHRHLHGARIEIVENNPHVIALRRRFRIPDDDARLQVFLGDGAEFLRERRGRYDILLVDGYDETGIPAALSTQRFYDDCRAALAPGGVMASNLYSTDHRKHVGKLRRSFGKERVLVLEEARQSNRVSFAWVDDPLPEGPLDADALTAPLPDAVRRELAAVFANVAGALRAGR